MDVIEGIAEEFITGNDPLIKCTKLLSSGGFGKVYEMKVVRSGKLFARKTIQLCGPINKEDIENEATAIEKLRTKQRHDNIVTIFRHGWLVSYLRGNSPLPIYYIDMELGGQSLQHYIEDWYSIRGPEDHLDLRVVWTIMLDISAGLEYLHRRGIIHRDLKPANVIQSLSIFPTVWKLADFGISTAGTAKRLIATKDSRGTERYRAPEILFSEPSVPSYTNKVDIWGLGLILYQLLTGKNAFQSDFDVMQYRSDGICPQLLTSSAYFERVMPHRKTSPALQDLLESMISMLEVAACLVLSSPGPVLAVRRHTSQPSRRIVINRLLHSFLQRDPTIRPTIEHVCLLVAANEIASNFESDPTDLSIKEYWDWIYAPFIVSRILDRSLALSRWQFVLKAKAVRLIPFLGTAAYFVREFLATDLEDLGLSQALLKLFSGKFDLCAEFKRLYVYGSTFDPTYRASVIIRPDALLGMQPTSEQASTEAELN